jgi:hypothetical protein
MENETEKFIEGRRGRRRGIRPLRIKKPKPLKIGKPKKISLTPGKDRYIKKLKKMINSLTQLKNRLFTANNRLITKNNTLLDNVQYFRTMIFGNQRVVGYEKAVVDAKIKNAELIKQELGEAIQENFDSNDSNYNAVFTENNILQNQIGVNTNNHSVDNQMYKNLASRIETLDYINTILAWILFGVILVSAYVIWVSNQTLTYKLVMVKVVWIYVIIVEILEYVLFYLVRYFRAVFSEKPYTANDFWKFPKLTWIDILIMILIVLSVFI